MLWKTINPTLAILADRSTGVAQQLQTNLSKLGYQTNLYVVREPLDLTDISANNHIIWLVPSSLQQGMEDSLMAALEETGRGYVLYPWQTSFSDSSDYDPSFNQTTPAQWICYSGNDSPLEARFVTHPDVRIPAASYIGLPEQDRVVAAVEAAANRLHVLTDYLKRPERYDEYDVRLLMNHPITSTPEELALCFGIPCDKDGVEDPNFLIRSLSALQTAAQADFYSIGGHVFRRREAIGEACDSLS